MLYNETALKIGTQLYEYTIESVLGVGGFGITYLAEDTNLKKRVVIKEFLPNDIAVRKDSSIVVPKSANDEENYRWSIKRFLQEAQTLAKFNNPNIVKVNRFFETNNTAYFVMSYEEGEDLEEYMKKEQPPMPQNEIYEIILPILNGLEEVHSNNFLHRDIKPANIFIRANKTPMLIDFGASRFAMGVKSKSLSVVLTEGYAPKEQYSSTSKQGAYTDIYSIGAVLYKMATGNTPPEASSRSDYITDGEDDPYERLSDDYIAPYSDGFKIAVDKALEFRAKDRPQNIEELIELLTSTVNSISSKNTKTKIVRPNTIENNKTKIIRSKSTDSISKEYKNNTNKTPHTKLIVIALITILIIVAGGTWYYDKYIKEKEKILIIDNKVDKLNDQLIKAEEVKRKADAKADKLRLKKEADAKADKLRLKKEADAKADKLRLKKEADAKADKLRLKKEADAKAEKLRLKKEADAKADKLRLKKEADAKADKLRLKKEADAKADKLRLKKEADAKAEKLRLKKEADAKAEKLRLKKEADAKADKLRLKKEADAKADKLRLKKEADAKADKLRLKKEADAKADKLRLKKEAKKAEEELKAKAKKLRKKVEAKKLKLKKRAEQKKRLTKQPHKKKKVKKQKTKVKSKIKAKPKHHKSTKRKAKGFNATLLSAKRGNVASMDKVRRIYKSKGNYSRAFFWCKQQAKRGAKVYCKRDGSISY